MNKKNAAVPVRHQKLTKEVLGRIHLEAMRVQREVNGITILGRNTMQFQVDAQRRKLDPDLIHVSGL
jgi:hypothetical protein